ncbi:MAG: ORF6N domain-containing protein [Myxococcaceae bacterium]
MENRIEKHIYTLRGVQVMLDTDLAEIYQVETKVLNQAVKRNIERFPADFMFEVTREEFENSSKWRQDVRSQFVTLRLNAKFQPYMPFAFTESGVAMLSGVLHSQRAIQINIEIMRVFVELRKQIKIRVESLEQRFNQLETQFFHRGSWIPAQGRNDTGESIQNPVDIIQNIVAEHFGLGVQDLKSPTRSLNRFACLSQNRGHLGKNTKLR